MRTGGKTLWSDGLVDSENSNKLRKSGNNIFSEDEPEDEPPQRKSNRSKFTILQLCIWAKLISSKLYMYSMVLHLRLGHSTKIPCVICYAIPMCVGAFYFYQLVTFVPI